jgi:hypothetical protein
MPRERQKDKAEKGEGIFLLISTSYYKGHNCAGSFLVLTYLRIHYGINLDFKMYAIAFKRPPLLCNSEKITVLCFPLLSFVFVL